MSGKFVAGHVTKMWFFEVMNYLSLNSNFALKLQRKCWKYDLETFTAHLSVTIKRLTRYKLKVVLADKLTANTNLTTLLKNKSAMKYLP